MDASRGRILTGLIRVAPHRGDHRVAIRAAVSLAVPLFTLWLLGRVDLSVYASFGAFASLYGRFDAYGDRVRMQIAAGVTMVAVMLVGTTLALAAAPVSARVGVVALLAGITTVFAHRWQWHPPGSLFVVFAAGATASIPATADSLLQVVTIGGGAALFSVLVTAGIAVGRGGLRGRGTRRGPGPDLALSQGIAVMAGTALGGLIGVLLIGDHWYWAMVAAVAALGGAQLNARVIRGIQRLGGTVVGIAIAAGLLALDLPPLATLAAAVVMQAGAELYVNRNYGLAMFFVTPLALLMVELALPAEPSVLLRDRALDTAIGVAADTLVAVVWAWWRARRRPIVVAGQ